MSESSDPVRVGAPAMPLPDALPEDLFAVWLAGFTAGEGYINLRDTAELVFTNTHRLTLEFIQARVGGSIRRLSRSKSTHRPCYQLCLYGDRARGLLERMLPYLGEKKTQAELVLSYRPRSEFKSPSAFDRLQERVVIRAKLKEHRHASS